MYDRYVSLLLLPAALAACGSESTAPTSSARDGPPTSLTATPASATAIDLAWQDNSDGEQGFSIERAPGQTSNFVAVTTVGPNVTTHRDTGLTQSTTYTYRVQSQTGGSASAYTNTASATTTDPLLIVDVANDVVNGATSTPAALGASPGADGISLREALLAVSAVPGPYDVVLSSALEGSTVYLGSPLPSIDRDGTRLIGVTASDGSPAITLDASAFTPGTLDPIATVAASDVVVQDLRFANVMDGNRAVRILVGPPPLPLSIADIRIENIVIDNRPHAWTAYGITIGPDEGSGSVVQRVSIVGSTFNHLQGDGTTIHLQGHGASGTLADVDIYDNTFIETTFAVELVNVQGSQNVIRNTRIVRNSFIGSLAADVTLLNGSRPTNPASANVIDATLVTGNYFASPLGWSLQVNGGSDGATGSSVTGTWFVNNVVEGPGGGVLAIGGIAGATANRVEGLHVVNSTFSQSGIAMLQNDAAGGNQVLDLDVRNSIFWTPPGVPPSDAFFNEMTPSLVLFSITGQAGYSGVNGNFDADPLFAAPESGDYHLMPGSPAIDAGSWDLAPIYDLDCRARTGLPDLGAFESGGAQDLCTSTLPDIPPP